MHVAAVKRFCLTPCLNGGDVRSFWTVCTQVLSAIFFAFEERPGRGVCVAEIVGGLSLLCAGNKSSKLAVSQQPARHPIILPKNIFEMT